MNEGPKTRRRFHFTLRAVLVLTALMAVVFAVSAKWPAWNRTVVVPRRVEIVEGWEVRHASVTRDVPRPPTTYEFISRSLIGSSAVAAAFTGVVLLLAWRRCAISQ